MTSTDAKAVNRTAAERADRTEGDVNSSSSRARWVDSHASAECRSLLDRDAAAFVHQSLSTPCLGALRECEGSYLTDVDGRRYLDFHGNSVHQIGHRHPKVIAAVIEQLQTLSFCPRRFTNVPAVELAERLISLAPPGLTKVLFAPGGSTAIGIALKLARLATGKHKTISMWDAFHGASLDASSVGGESLFRAGLGPMMPGCSHVPPPYPYRCVFGCGGVCAARCADYVEYVLDREQDVGAVIAEPIRCTSVLVPPPGFWQRVRAACDRRGVLLIFDEIPTGLGRTGDMFASQTVGVAPDMLVIGKGLGGGVMPIAAVLAHGRLDCAPLKAVGHYTHEKSPVAAAAANATLDVISGEKLPSRSRDLGDYAMARLRDLAKRFPIIGEVRGAGLLIGVELVLDRASRLPNTDVAERLMYRCLSDGLSFKISSGNIVTLTPPLTLTREQMDTALSIIESNLASLADTAAGCST